MMAVTGDGDGAGKYKKIIEGGGTRRQCHCQKTKLQNGTLATGKLK